MATALLADLVDRGLDTSQGVLVVIDGAKALRKAVRDVLGYSTPVQRCVRHKERNLAATSLSATTRRSSPAAGGMGASMPRALGISAARARRGGPPPSAGRPAHEE